MRNAKVAAFIYEYLYCILEEMDRDNGHYRIPDEDGVLREAFCHEFSSRWEWSTQMLETAGVLRRIEPPKSARAAVGEALSNLRSPYFYPLMTLEECRNTDFSAFETFDNYCHALFTFDQFFCLDFESNDLWWSPQAKETIGMMDDIFIHDGAGTFTFSQDRFNEKVMTHWDEMEVRTFRAKTEDSTN